MTRQIAGGRHRAPGRIATTMAQGRYSATSPCSVAASGGILASSFLIASTQPTGELQATMAALEPLVGPDVAADAARFLAADRSSHDEAATFAATIATLSRTGDAMTLPGTVAMVSEWIDRPARAAAAPADAENAVGGELGFVGITPAPTPVEEAAASAEETAEVAEVVETDTARSRSLLLPRRGAGPRPAAPKSARPLP